MKHLKKSFISALLAVAMLITCFLSLGSVNAGAVNPDLFITLNTIYYFTDLYPTLHEDVLFDEFDDDYNIVYDHQGITKDTFTYMVGQGYFTGFDESCVVIIDIKTFMPDCTVLFELFDSLKNDQGCKTVFVTAFTENQFNDTSFINDLDIFFEDICLERFGFFIDKALDDLYNENGMLVRTSYLIDGTWGEVLAYPNFDLETLCAAFPPLRVFLEKLLFRLYGCEEIPYDTCIEALVRDQVKILVHTGGNSFVEILTELPYSCNINQILHDYETNSDHACAFGVWAFQLDYYQCLYNIQIAQAYDLPIYAMVVDPLVYGEDGLINERLETDISLEVPLQDNAAIELLAELRQLLNS